MTRIWLFLHYAGFVSWLGGSLAAGLMAAVNGPNPGPAAAEVLVRGQVAVQKMLAGPGALVAVISGFFLMLRLYASGATEEVTALVTSPWLVVMEVSGVVGALLVLFAAVPTASRLGRLEATGPGAALFDFLRRRLDRLTLAAGACGLLALFAGAML